MYHSQELSVDRGQANKQEEISDNSTLKELYLWVYMHAALDYVQSNLSLKSREMSIERLKFICRPAGAKLSWY